MVNSLVIPLPTDRASRSPVFIGERPRQSSATSVVLLDPSTLACCHFNDCRMFLIKFDLLHGTYSIADSIDTQFAAVRCETDLMATDGDGQLITTNFFQHTCSLYRYDGSHVAFVRDLPYSAGDRVHGVKFYDGSTAAVTSRYDASGVHFFDLESLRRKFFIRMKGQGASDVCFLSDNRLAVITTLGHPNLRAFNIYASRAYILEFDIAAMTARSIACRQFEKSHFDNMVYFQDRLYITDQYNNKVRVLDAQSLDEVDEWKGLTFPHGVDVKFGLAAVTNYGNNTILLRALPNSYRA